MKFPSPARLLRAVGATVLAAGVLAACGGSTEQLDTFIPSRLVVFGDEFSALSDPEGSGNGSNYAINALDTTDTTNSTISCSTTSSMIWVQRLASHYGLVFKECNPNKLDEDQLEAFMMAGYGATVRAVATQVESFQANITHDKLGSSDMVTLWVGLHDVLEVYEDNLSFSVESQKVTELTRRGAQLAAVANSLMDTGARVLVAQLMDVGETPWALSQGSAEAKLLTRLSQAFNEGMRQNLVNDGTKVGLLVFNDTISNLVQYGGYETSEVACDEDHVEDFSVADDDNDGYIDGGGKVSACTTATLRADTAATKYLWADGLRLNARVAHAQLGNAAIVRATNNPF